MIFHIKMAQQDHLPNQSEPQYDQFFWIIFESNFLWIYQIYGTIEASADRADYSKDGKHWLLFDSVQNLVVQGGGTINGNGKIWWQNSCKINKALVSINSISKFFNLICHPVKLSFFKNPFICPNLFNKKMFIKVDLLLLLICSLASMRQRYVN